MLNPPSGRALMSCVFMEITVHINTTTHNDKYVNNYVNYNLSCSVFIKDCDIMQPEFPSSCQDDAMFANNANSSQAYKHPPSSINNGHQIM